MTAKHTPGPWKKQDLGEHPRYPDWHSYAIRDSKTNVCLAVVGKVDRYFEKNNDANAALIAAAPDLLAALEVILARAAFHGKLNRAECESLARAAIDKAKGGGAEAGVV